MADGLKSTIRIFLMWWCCGWTLGSSDAAERPQSGPSKPGELNCGGVCLQMLRFCQDRQQRKAAAPGPQSFRALFVTDPADPAQELAERYPDLIEPDISLHRLCQIAAEIDLDVAMASYDPANLPAEATHIIAHRSDEHFVLLSRSNQGEWLVFDPPKPTVSFTRQSAAKLSGMGILVLGNAPPTWAWRFYGIAGLIGVGVALSLRRFTRKAAVTVGCFVVPAWSGCDGYSPADPPVLNSVGRMVARQTVRPAAPTFGFQDDVVDLGDRAVEAGPIKLNAVLYTQDPQPPHISTSCGCTQTRWGEFDEVNRRRILAIEIAPLKPGRNDVWIAAKNQAGNEVSSLRVLVHGTSKLSISMNPQLENDGGSTDNVLWGVCHVVGSLPEEHEMEVRFQCPAEFGYCENVWVTRAASGEMRLEIDRSHLRDVGAGFVRFFDDRSSEICDPIPVAWTVSDPALINDAYSDDVNVDPANTDDVNSDHGAKLPGQSLVGHSL